MANKGNKKQHNKIIVLNIDEKDYVEFLRDNEFTRKIIDNEIEEHPELFPKSIREYRYKLNGRTRVSKKTGYKMVKIKICDEQYQIRPYGYCHICAGKQMRPQINVFVKIQCAILGISICLRQRCYVLVSVISFAWK